MAGAYYNEIDPYCAEWLRRLMAEGWIAPGEVDERSITDVRPDDLKGFSQCHFFAGLGGWSYAMRLAGWADEEEVWTGSCPCQPLSWSGLGQGASDERHLWPAFRGLISECWPSTIFGEQVASRLGLEWAAAVRLDLEEGGYAFGAGIVPGFSVSAPHRRDRTFWVASNANGDKQPRREPRCRPDRRVGRQQQLFPWDAGWPEALARFRVVDDGIPRCVAATDAARNAIIPQVAARFIQAADEAVTISQQPIT